MEKEKKLTKKDYYGMLGTIVEGSEIENKHELLSFIEKEVALIDAKAEKAKEKAAERKAAGDELREVVKSVLTGDNQTIADITAQIEGEDITKAKITARLTQLVNAGIAVKTDVKNEETGKMIKAYRLA